MSESADLTYYHRNLDVILNRAKYYYKNDEEKLEKQEKVKIKKENMGGIGIAICLKKRNKD